MSFADFAYKTLNAANKKLTSCFNLATGNTRLIKRGLDRPDDGAFSGSIGSVGGPASAIMVGLLTAPLIGPLAIIPALAAGSMVGFGPAQLEASYAVGKANKQAERPTPMKPL